MSKLRQIFEEKVAEVDLAKTAIPFEEIRAAAVSAPAIRPFRQALAQSPHPLALIAEVKKGSPSRGLIRGNFDAAEVSDAYRRAGADCLSVLTDEKHFQGSRENLTIARRISGLPCLRKDFIFDPYQVYESRSWGADCILLIVAAFVPSPAQMFDGGLLADLWALGKGLGMDVLVEVHSDSEVEVALKLGADLIGINNRNLSDMSTCLGTSEVLLPLVREHALAVSESALESGADLARVQTAGARAVLIGTSFCSAPNVESKVREVMGW